MSEIAESQGEVLPEDTGDAAEIEESATSSEETSAEPEEQKKPRGVQKRLDELTANWREEQRRSERLLEQNLELQRQLTQRPEPAREEPKQPTEPRLDDYSSYEDYVGALADYKAEQKLTEILSRQEREQEEREHMTRRQSAREQFDERALAFADAHPDFDRVARNPDLHVTEEMADLLNASERGPDILYHLGQNPQESARIARLPVAQAAMELGRIEARLAALQPNTRTGAPDPIEPISQGTGARSPDPDKMSPNEWLRWRNAQLENRA